MWWRSGHEEGHDIGMGDDKVGVRKQLNELQTGVRPGNVVFDGALGEE